MDEADGTSSESKDAQEKSKEFYSGDQAPEDEDEPASANSQKDDSKEEKSTEEATEEATEGAEENE